MSLYSKFLKDFLTKKGKYINSETILGGGNCSVVIQKLPPKFKDPGSVTIPYSIGDVSIGKALINLGESINLMSLSMCKRIGNLKIDPIRMTLQLADCSITRPFGVVEDILVKVCHFTFPVDFVIMDIEENEEILLILGRPFMLIAKCVVDMGNRNLELSVDDQKVTFNLFEAIKHPSTNKPCFRVEAVKQEPDHAMQHLTTRSPLEKALINAVDCLTNEEEKDLEACLEDLEQLKVIHVGKDIVEALKEDNPPEKTKLELKTLPTHLKYAFLEGNDLMPVVISNNLSAKEEARLMEVLKKHKEAIGWHISDLK
ncbi:uncharacterized protein LOC114373491 [Glycine soja]|uniref:uncharacterized protein n=1 Tax=Glycine max TaxID=3847 RepID=UPI0003DE902C|nr:uncharacterized protein LOC100801289 [Glycine max]XP_028186763.1 uncharacterized protein LOC114373491 [Glycine soja]|eukprot:XP_006575891.1 uncharacterized protein LOC100801289 [Glycine max]